VEILNSGFNGTWLHGHYGQQCYEETEKSVSAGCFFFFFIWIRLLGVSIHALVCALQVAWQSGDSLNKGNLLEILLKLTDFWRRRCSHV